VSMGWKAMSKLARLTPRNTKRNCHSLIAKLALEQLSDENSRESIGRTYRLFSYKAILERRRAAGLEWVMRSRGVVFVGAPPPPASEPPVRIVAGLTAQRRFETVPAAKAEPAAPVVERDPGVERDTGVKSTIPPTVVAALREYLPGVDDESVLALVSACREKAADATDDEIGYFVRLKADLMYRMGTIKSPMGFLKTAVPRCFEGESFRQFREAESRRRHSASIEQFAREQEMRRFREEQRAILENPASSEEDRKFARQFLDNS
jgi:hypothetical protein